MDVACGTGRNALLIARMGCDVVCLDRDLGRLKVLKVRSRNSIAGSIFPLQCVLGKDRWPFGTSTLSGIIDVHFLDTSLFGDFTRSLRPGGLLLVETFGGQGGNYLDLPRAREIRSKLRRAFDFVVYRERKVGPRGTNAASVQVLAVKR